MYSSYLTQLFGKSSLKIRFRLFHNLQSPVLCILKAKYIHKFWNLKAKIVEHIFTKNKQSQIGDTNYDGTSRYKETFMNFCVEVWQLHYK